MENYRKGLCCRPDEVDLAADAGYDYIELNLNDVLRLSEGEYRKMAHHMADHDIYAEVVCGMLPRGAAIVGPDVVARQLHEALDRSFDLAQALGARYVILDCEDARRLPPDFDSAMAWRQFGNFVRMLQSYAVRFDLRIAMLPMRRSAVDIVNYASEAAMICAMLQLDRVGVAVSSFNMALEAESLPGLMRVGSLLWHVRTSNVLGNLPPRAGDGEDYVRLFSTLQRINYHGRVSCEAACATPEIAAEALRCLREAEGEQD